jgi:hypothetical protein
MDRHMAGSMVSRVWANNNMFSRDTVSLVNSLATVNINSPTVSPVNSLAIRGRRTLKIIISKVAAIPSQVTNRRGNSSS